MMGWGLRADEDIGPYDLGPPCVARDDPARVGGRVAYTAGPGVRFFNLSIWDPFTFHQCSSHVPEAFLNSQRK